MKKFFSLGDRSEIFVSQLFTFLNFRILNSGALGQFIVGEQNLKIGRRVFIGMGNEALYCVPPTTILLALKSKMCLLSKELRAERMPVADGEMKTFDFDESKNSFWRVIDQTEFSSLITSKDFVLRDSPVLYLNYRFELHDSLYVGYFRQDGQNFEIKYYPAPGQGRDISAILECLAQPST